MTKFSELGLSAPIVQALDELGFTSPTEIQKQAIPLLSADPCDFIGLAQTGTGKTAAFGLPLLQNINFDENQIQSLILAPTRELAQQIAVGLNDFGKHIKGLNVQVVYGGADIRRQITQLRSKVNILVATPGRLIDLIKRKALSLEAIRYVVLDEADEMLNMGFKEDLNTILSYMPKSKSTWLFSATMPSAIQNIVKNYMTDPVKVSVNSETKVNVNIEHQYMVMKATDKFEVITRMLDYNPDMYGVIFCRTKMDTQQLAETLRKNDYSADALNGDLSQSQRDSVMRRFKAHQVKVLVATDVAARGIDVNDLTHVIHHRLPDEMEFYTHRSGRTARAGKKGISLVLATKGDVRKLRFFENKLGINFEKKDVPKLETIRANKVSHWANAIVKEEASNEIAKEEWQAVNEILGDLTKDELVAKLLTRELNAMKKFKSAGDLNVPEGNDRGDRRERGDRRDRGDRRERGERSERESKPGRKGYVKYFINLGKMDGASKKELHDFVIEETGINTGQVGEITVEDRRSYFEVKDEVSGEITDSFKGIIVNGRDIRVNREDSAKRAGRSSSRRKDFDKKRGSKRDSGKGRGGRR